MLAKIRQTLKKRIDEAIAKLWEWMALARILRLLDTPLPSRWWAQLAAIFGLACLPFIPFQLSPWPLPYVAVTVAASVVIAAALYVFLERVITSLVIAQEARAAILDKIAGLRPSTSERLVHLHKTPWRGFLQLVFTVVTVGAVVVLATSSITYSVINHLGFRSPFGSSPTIIEVLWYYMDEAARGMTASFLDAIKVTTPRKLQFDQDAQHTAILGGGIWAYRLLATALTVQVGWLLFTFVRAKTDPRLAKLHARVHSLEAELSRREGRERDEEFRKTWPRMRQEIAKNEGRTTRDQRDVIDARVNDISGRIQEENDYELVEQLEKEQSELEAVLQKSYRLWKREKRQNGRGSNRNRRQLEGERRRLQQEKDDTGWLEPRDFRRLRELQRELAH